MRQAVYRRDYAGFPDGGIVVQTFRRALRTRDVTISAELELDGRSTPASVVDAARSLGTLIDAVQVTDNPVGRVHPSPLVLAAALIDAGIDPVLHMTCRDRNGVALHSDLLGAAAIGVSSVLAMRGRKFPTGFSSTATAVFDWNVKRLIADARAIRSDPGLDAPADFFIGSPATVFDPVREWRPQKIRRRADAGVRFLQTQLCYDLDIVARYMAGLVSARLLERVRVIVSVAPLASVEVAEWLKANLRGAVIPDVDIERLRRADNPREEGIRLCAEKLRALSRLPGVSGANVLTLGDVEAVALAIRASGLRPESG